MSVKVYFGIGSNLNRENALRFAKASLEKLMPDLRVSSVWASNAVREAEPQYYNMVAGGTTDMKLEELLGSVNVIEAEAGSELMFNNGTNFGVKRRLDIDILLYGDLITTTPCKLPRHDIQDYPFVLCPLCELDPNIIHPLLKLRIGDIWNEMEPRLPEKRKVEKVAIDWSIPAPDWPEEGQSKNASL